MLSTALFKVYNIVSYIYCISKVTYTVRLSIISCSFVVYVSEALANGYSDFPTGCLYIGCVAFGGWGERMVGWL